MSSDDSEFNAPKPVKVKVDVDRLNAERKCIMNLLDDYLNTLSCSQDKIFVMAEHLRMTDGGFYDFNRLEEHIEFCQYFSDNVEHSNLQTICAKWRRLLPDINRLNERFRKYYAPIPKRAAAFCILEGQYYKAVSLLFDAILLDAREMSVWFPLLWWLVFLQDWPILGVMLRKEKDAMKAITRTDGYGTFVECCWLVRRLHTSMQLSIADEIVSKLRDILTADKKTYLYSSCKVLLKNALVYASRLPMADLQKIGDPLYNRTSALEICELILHNRLPKFVKQDESISNTLRSKLTKDNEFANADEFLRIFSTIADYFEISQICADDLFEVGLVREADAYCSSAWKHGVMFGVPHRALVPLSYIFYMRSITTLERNLLANYGRCLNALVTPKVAVRRNIMETPKNMRALRARIARTQHNHGHLNNPSSTVDDVINQLGNFRITEVTREVIPLTVHMERCDCVICRLRGTDDDAPNWHFSIQISWIAFMFSGFEPSQFEIFREKCKKLRIYVLNQRQVFWREAITPMIRTNFTEFLTPQLLELWIRAYACKALEESVTDSTDLNEGVQLCKYSPLRFRSSDLLLKLLQHESSLNANTTNLTNLASPGHFSASKETVPSISSQTRSKATTSNATEMRHEVKESYYSQKEFGHLFFREWRQRNCLFLAQNIEAIWHKALFLMEVATPAVRQCARFCQHGKQSPSMEKGVECSESAASNLYFNSSAQLQSFVQSLPEEITLVNFVLDKSGTLWLIRCHALHEPIILPVINQIQDNEILSRMRNLLVQNDESVSSRTDPKKFWSTRRKLDSDLKNLVADWQETWFGDLAALLIPLSHGFPSHQTSLMGNLKKIEQKFTKQFGCSKALSSTLMRLSDHIPEKQWKRLAEGMIKLQDPTLEEFAQSSEFSANIAKYYRIIYEAIGSNRSARKSRKKYTLLIVPPQLNFLPWECMPIFECAPLVSRIPSVHFFDYLMNRTKTIPKEVDGRNSYYVLNPSGDLSNTQQRISVFVERYKWHGVVGKAPSKEEIQSALAAHDLFLYMGHGSGGRYFGRSSIRHSDCRAVSVLMGCSSACIQDMGPTFDGKGYLYDYLIAKCPCIVGCLWMVTDGEIDRFFMALMNYCFNGLDGVNSSGNVSSIAKDEDSLEKSAGAPLLGTPIMSTPSVRQTTRRQINKADETPIAKRQPLVRTKAGNKENENPPSSGFENYKILVEGVVQARKACKLPYLTGASVVSYGLPIISKSSSLTPITELTSPEILTID